MGEKKNGPHATQRVSPRTIHSRWIYTDEQADAPQCLRAWSPEGGVAVEEREAVQEKSTDVMADAMARSPVMAAARNE